MCMHFKAPEIIIIYLVRHEIEATCRYKQQHFMQIHLPHVSVSSAESLTLSDSCESSAIRLQNMLFMINRFFFKQVYQGICYDKNESCIVIW